MTKDITLFSNGLVKSTFDSSQPELATEFETKIQEGWNKEEICSRTQKAIKHASKFIPTFSSAIASGPPLFGAQQIPGKNPSLRAANVSFPSLRYARVEIVKGSSALSASDAILQRISDEKLLNMNSNMLNLSREESFDTLLGIKLEEVVQKAENIARNRNWPLGLARVVGKRSNFTNRPINCEKRN